MYLNEYPFQLSVDVRNRSIKTGWANVGKKATPPMDSELIFTLENIHVMRSKEVGTWDLL